MYLDISYLYKLSPLLPLFKAKGDNTFNARCVICGDSQRNKFKARFYIFPSTDRSQLICKCHNCGYAHSFQTFLKAVGDPMLYREYQFEKFKNNISSNTNLSLEQTTIDSNESATDHSLIDQLLCRVDQLPTNHKCVEYCIKRLIPREQWKYLYFIENIGDIEQLSDKYKNKIVDTDSRLVLPIYDRDGSLGGVTCRSLDPEHPRRYVMIKIRDSSPMIFGLDRVDFSKKIYCVEGPIDSLFLPNCVAVNNADFRHIDRYIPKQQTTIVLDNQPKNKEIVSMYRKVCDRDYNVMIWPQNIAEKDINEFVTAHQYSSDQLTSLINTNTFSGLSLKLALENWRRI
jgi:hypothetical protein